MLKDHNSSLLIRFVMHDPRKRARFEHAATRVLWQETERVPENEHGKILISNLTRCLGI